MPKVKNPDNVKRGRANKMAGKRAERELEAFLISYGLDVKKVALSGGLKNTNLVGSDTGMLKGDLQLYVNGQTYLLESKKRCNLDGLYNLYEKIGNYSYEYKYVIVDIDTLIHWLYHKILPANECGRKTPKYIIDYFSQDDCDIVAVKMNRKPWLFIINLEGSAINE